MHSFLQQMNFGILLSLGALGLFWLAAFGAGRIFTRCLHLREVVEDHSGLLIELVLGMNLLALLTLAAGSVNMLNRNVILVGLCGLTFTGFVISGTAWSRAWHKFFAWCRGNWPLALSVIILAIFTVGSALCYPYAWDEQTYHIALPYRWLASGNLAVFADNPYSGFPAMPQILFRSGIEIGGIFFPRLLVWSIYLMLLVNFYLILRRDSEKWLALFISLLIITSPLFITMMRETYVEPFIALNLAAAWLLCPKYQTNRTDFSVPILLGVFAGGAAAVKLTGLAVAVLIVLPLIRGAINRKLKHSFKEIIIFGLVALAVAAPFYLRPWWYTGNPLFPFMAEWFGDNSAALAVADYHQAMGRLRFGVEGVAGFITGAILVAFHGRLFDGITTGWQFPLLLLLMVVYLIRGIRDKAWTEIWWLPVAFVFYYCFWFFSSPQTRFLMPLYLVVAIGGVKGLAALNKPIRNGMIVLLLATSLISIDWREMRHFILSWQHVVFPTPVEFFLGHASKDHEYIEALTALTAHTPRESQVMLIFERRGLYVPRAYVIGTPFFQGKYFTPLPANDRVVFNTLKQNKIDYLLLGSALHNPDHLPQYNDDNLRFARQLAKLIGRKELSLVWSNDDYNLFKIN